MSQEISYTKQSIKMSQIGEKTIAHFEIDNQNIDLVTVDSFGEEWEKFNDFSSIEITNVGNEYFDIIDLNSIREYNVLDVGCGTGRWTKFIAPYVKHVDAIDPSKAIISAAALLNRQQNVRLSQASVSNLPFEDESFDLVFSLGVLHHIPDTQLAMNDAVKKVKKGGKFLVYLYYNLDNKGVAYKMLFRCSTIFRLMISKMPNKLKAFVCDIIAFCVYVPFILLSKFVKFVTPKSKAYTKVPLSYYVGKSINIVRNDALDRFGTPLEQRFSKKEIQQMMENAGLQEIIFSNNAPYWHAVGIKKNL